MLCHFAVLKIVGCLIDGSFLSAVRVSVIFLETGILSECDQIIGTD